LNRIWEKYSNQPAHKKSETDLSTTKSQRSFVKVVDFSFE